MDNIRIIQLPESSGVSSGDYIATDNENNGTKKIEFTNLLDTDLSNANKAAQAKATGDALNAEISARTSADATLNSRVDSLIANQANESITTLWTGNLSTVNSPITLNDSVANYDFIDVYYAGIDNNFTRIPRSNGGADIHLENLSDDATTNFLQVCEIHVSFSGTSFSITKGVVWEWLGNFTNPPTVTANTVLGNGVVRINGVKIGHINNDEIIDARIGADGITYPNLGTAIRTQFSDLKNDLDDAVYSGELPLNFSDMVNAYCSSTIDSEITFINSTASKTIKKIIPVKKGWGYKLSITYGASPSSLNNRSSCITDASNIVKQVLVLPTEANATHTITFASVTDGFLYLCCDKSYTSISIQGGWIYENAIRINQIEKIVGTLSSENILPVSEIIRSDSGTSYVIDESTGELTITCNTGTTNRSATTGDKFNQARLISGRTYRLHAKYQTIAGNPAPKVVVQGTLGNVYGTAAKIEFENNEGYVDFVADKYMTRICFYVSGATSASGAVIKYSDIWLKEYNDNAYNGRKYDYTDCLSQTNAIPLGNYSVGDVVDVTPLEQSGSSHYTMILSGIMVGEKFNIFAIDGTTSRPWAFLDADYKLLSMAYNAYAENVELIAPTNAEYLIVQVGSSSISSASIIRQESFNYLLNGKRIGIEQLNDPVETVNLLENATSLAGYGSELPNNRTNIFSLLHFSDIHGDAPNIERVLVFKNLYSKYIRDILHTGDSPETYYGNVNPFALIGGDSCLNVVGNHDCWIQGANPPYSATAEQVYTKFFAPFISNWNVVSAGENLCYYYKDYATAKVRLIVLDCMHYDTTQESWFASVLQGAITNNYRVVAVTHYPSETGLTLINCTFSRYGSTISPSQTERMPESAFTAVDTFIGNGGEFVCWLSGHTHGDYIGTVNGHTDQIQIIVSTDNPDKPDSDAPMVRTTKSQDLFNIFVVDGVNKLIKLVRIGADKDRYLRSRKTLCLNYETKDVISNL